MRRFDSDMTLKSPIVIDTNIVLDLLVFGDTATSPLQAALAAGEVDWIATTPMRDELARVLAYAQITPRLVFYQLSADDVMAAFDRQTHILAVAPKASVTCSDADDQKFIDLAVAHRAPLLSKDKAVLAMTRRLQVMGVRVTLTLERAAL